MWINQINRYRAHSNQLQYNPYFPTWEVNQIPHLGILQLNHFLLLKTMEFAIITIDPGRGF